MKHPNGATKGKTAPPILTNGAAPHGHKFVLEDPAKLVPHPQNYRKHPEDQLTHIIASVKEYGFYRNIVVGRNNTILAGHGVVQAALKMELAKVPIVRLDLDPESPDALKLLAGDNEISNLVDNDDRALTELLKTVRDQSPEGLLGTGFDDKMLAALLMVTRPESEIRGTDEAAAWVGMPEFGTKEETPKLAVLFRNKKDRDEFVKKTGLKPTYRSDAIWTAWYPHKGQDDLASVKFRSNGKPKTSAAR